MTHHQETHPLWQFLNFERFVRDAVVESLVPEGARVLELRGEGAAAVGTWVRSRIGTYIGIEATAQEKETANTRWSAHGAGVEVQLLLGDPGRERLVRLLEAAGIGRLKVDAVACFHGVQAAWLDQPALEQSLQDVAALLRKDGHFFGFVPDSGVVWSRAHRGGETAEEISGDLYRLQLHDRNFATFGSSYTLTVPGTAAASVEYLVHFPTLIRTARPLGLDLVDILNFSAFLDDYGGLFSSVLRQKNVLDRQRKILPAQLDYIGLHAVFVFRKKF